MPNSMWNGNYGKDEASRRADYDRGNSSSYKVGKAKEAISSPGGTSSVAKAVPENAAKDLQKAMLGK